MEILNGSHLRCVRRRNIVEHWEHTNVVWPERLLHNLNSSKMESFSTSILALEWSGQRSGGVFQSSLFERRDQPKVLRA